MRRSLLLFSIFCALAAPAAYIAMPFWTAWSIREAIKTGDSDYLARKIDFEGVRETLRPSLAQVAFDMPDPSASEPAPKPGLWKRIKDYWGQGAINRLAVNDLNSARLRRAQNFVKRSRNDGGAALGSTDPVTSR